MDTSSTPRNPAALWRRLVWFASLWGLSVFALGIVCLSLRIWLHAGRHGEGAPAAYVRAGGR
jgi:hypothetical protein